MPAKNKSSQQINNTLVSNKTKISNIKDKVSHNTKAMKNIIRFLLISESNLFEFWFEFRFEFEFYWNYR